MFKKIATTIQQGEATDRACSPHIIPHGKLLGIVGQAQGCKAYFVCDELYFPTVLHGLFSGNVWTGLTEPCELENKIPSTLRPIGGLYTGQCVILQTNRRAVHRTVCDPSNLDTICRCQSEDGSQKFLNVQFEINEKMIYRRANLDGVLFEKESGLPYWPLAVGTDVIVKVCIEETLFRINIDSVEMFTYVRRPSNHTMEKTKFLGFNVTTIVFTDLT